ncbi:hypothetical protein [Pyrococcus abyssi]|uniref:Transmembrane protein n=1 Tax=Pyrococcus abyssi (strain GE5 / Orsay) TaxID=272844 RepID=G8ZI18_PYRAB|nr:hypothetical protein [Pyrococcus abyssi]CCE69761.1 TPA: hypothetical protein PAB2407.1n [Pyrococcus abyssi GE5]
MSPRVFFWLAIIFIMLSTYLGMKKKKIESMLSAGLAGGFALAFVAYEKLSIGVSFLIGFVATILFELSFRRR